jgi:hypothetical protein
LQKNTAVLPGKRIQSSVVSNGGLASPFWALPRSPLSCHDVDESITDFLPAARSENPYREGKE